MYYTFCVYYQWAWPSRQLVLVAACACLVAVAARHVAVAARAFAQSAPRPGRSLCACAHSEKADALR